ncbi:MAG: metallophosphoesterase [Pseudobutyrivibrio sp.]|nr:metallophosphoesterase [Pseudobutyrivibrio sp.]
MKKVDFGIKITLRILAVLIILGLLGFVSPLHLKRYDLHFDNLPEEFDGYKIIQISDFHCKEFGDKESTLIKMVKKTHPDIILLTGDIVDEKHTVDNARYLLEGITDIAPVYFVTGNHEYYDGAPYDQFIDICYDLGVTILDDESVPIEKNGATILLSGLDWKSSTAHMKGILGYADSNYFNILMAHDSSKFNFYAEYDYDLVFSGHGHGGLIRIPFIGGVFGTDGTFFPEYDYGIFKMKNSEMVSSSGLGDARIPRWNNAREVVLVKLHKNK